MRTINDIHTGCIKDDPLKGLCDIICINVNKVFDGCIARISDHPVTVEITGYNFAPVPPLRFDGATNYGHTHTVSNLNITPLAGSVYSRVEFDTNIEVEINCTDSEGNSGLATGVVVEHLDLVLKIPHSGQLPFSIEASGNMYASQGTFLDLGTANLTCCVAIVIRVLGQVDILVPSYGYAVLDSFDGESLCQNLFNRPVYPYLRRNI